MVCLVQCRESDIQCQSPMSRYYVVDVDTVQESSNECQPEAMLRRDYCHIAFNKVVSALVIVMYIW